MAFRYDSYNDLVYARVPERSRVLDVGCATGRLSEALENAKFCICAGLEGDPQLVAVARERCSGGVELVDLDDEWVLAQVLSKRPPYDVVVCADVLEHLREPARVLRQLIAVVRPGGRVICSVPNIAFWRKRLMLLRGRWEYEEVGICDRTHVRFYTEASARRMLNECGLLVKELVYAGVGGRYRHLKGRFPTVFASGFIIDARLE